MPEQVPPAPFSHLVAGTAESHWRASPRLREMAALQVPPGSSLVVLAAHPDDETLAAAGLIASVLAAGGRVDVVLASAGENSHPGSPGWTPARLARARHAEMAHAMAALGDGVVLHWLGYPDGGLQEHEQSLARDVRGAITEGHQVGRCVLAAPWRHDGHPDHDTMGRIAAGIARDQAGTTLLEYPIWFWHWGDDGRSEFPWTRARRVELTPARRAAKSRAMAEHLTQVRPLSPMPGDEAILPPAILAHFTRSFETFLVQEAVVPAPADAANRG